MAARQLVMRTSLTARLVIAGGVLAVVVTVAVLALLHSNAALDEATDRRAEARLGLVAMIQVERDTLDLETGVRGFVITGKELFLAPWRQAARRLPRDVATLRQRMRNRRDDRALAMSLATDATRYLREYTVPVIAAVRAGSSAAASEATTAAGKRQVDRIRRTVNSLNADLTADATRFSQKADDEAHAATRMGIAALVASSAILLLIAYLLRGVVVPLRRVGAAADDLAAGDLTARAPQDGVRELAQLGTSFNRMAATIAESQTALDARNVELIEANTEADRANLAKSEFLSRMSHELRTPLNAILGFAQLLEFDALNPGQRESLDQISRGGRHLLHLIDEVLDIARVEAGELRLSPEPTGAAELVHETLALVTPLAEHRSIALLSDFGTWTDTHVLADRQRLKQILLNLFSNAIKYNREAGEVHVSLQLHDSERLTIAVRDTGAGLSREQLDRIFEPFERLGAEQRSIEGTGLGLALSRRLAQAMGAELKVDSEPGHGSTFSIELEVVAAPQLAEEPVHLLAEPTLGQRKILYIEDNVSNLRLVERVLARHSKVTFLPAMQGTIGLELAREHHPDMILLDLHLPDLGGHEVLVRLKAEPATQHTPVVVLSADASPGQIRRLHQAGAAAYLTKPINLEELLETVRSCLGDPTADGTPAYIGDRTGNGDPTGDR
jgi:signal transduction histidine kinase/CheY-like chemotaxis protein